jgi:FlaG/FlaF family flagellin (archaellin)
MKIRKLRRNLAVSTIVANMMMITITLSLAAILVAWAGTTYGSFSGGSQLFFLQRGQAMQERFVVENVWFNKTGGANQMMIFVRNVGAREVKVVGLYIDGAPITLTSSNVLAPCTVTSGSATLVVGSGNPNSVCEFRIVISPVWTTGHVFSIVVASDKGNQATYSARGI